VNSVKASAYTTRIEVPRVACIEKMVSPATAPKRSPWVQTRDGNPIDLLKPDLKKLKIEEVAHSLARINRFSGHTRCQTGYSVAQHSVLVARHLPEQYCFAGLTHDMHEAIIGDVTSPVKWALQALGDGGAFNQLDEIVSTAMHKRFGVRMNAATKRAVREADLKALMTECRDLLGGECRPWGVEFEGAPVEPWPERITPWDVLKAEKIFLIEYDKLRRWR
jgi:uncharacterized protein